MRVQDALVRLLISMERYGDAVVLLKRTLTVEEHVSGEQSVEVANTHKLFASVRLAQEKPAAAIKHLRKSVDIYRVARGPKHTSTQKAEALLAALEAPEKDKDKRPKFFVGSRRTKLSDQLGRG